jgi:hypothetical protein
MSFCRELRGQVGAVTVYDKLGGRLYLQVLQGCFYLSFLFSNCMIFPCSKSHWVSVHAWLLCILMRVEWLLPLETQKKQDPHIFE